MSDEKTGLEGLVDADEALAPEQVNAAGADATLTSDGVATGDQDDASPDMTGPDPTDPDTESPEARIAALEAELAEANEQTLRAVADLQNTRRRVEREIADVKTYAIARFAEDLLSVSDNLARALTALPEADRATLSEAGRNLLGGIEMTEKELHAALARHGVVAVDAVPGAVFDPNLHQAVSQVPSPHPAGTIAETYQSGWKIGDRTLRAAMVAVSAGPAN